MELRIVFALFRRWYWLLILGLLLGAGVGYAISYYQVPSYRATTQVLITGESNDLDATARRQSLQELVGTYTQLLSTRAISSLAAERLGYGVSPNSIGVQAVPNTKLFQVSYVSTDPQRAADTANMLVEVLVEQNGQLQSDRVSSSASGLEAQLEQLQSQIRALEESIAGISTTTRDQQKLNLETQIAALETEIDNTQREILNLSAQINAVVAEASLLATQTAQSVGEGTPVPLATPAGVPIELQVSLETARTRLERLQEDLVRYQQAYFDLTVLGKTDSARESQDEVQLEQLQTELQLYRDLYTNLLSEYELARMTSLNSVPGVVQVDKATPPSRPLRNQTVTNIIFGGSVGLILAITLAFIIEYSDDTLKSREEITRLFGAPVIGQIRYSRSEFKDNEVFVNKHPRSPITESLRTIRTNLEFANVDRQLKCFLITSANPGEGKTTVAGNLAVIMARSGQRVIVVDADLRRPASHELFNVRNAFGLTNVLIGQSTVEEVLQASEDQLVSILSSGPIPPNPTELLGSGNMSKVLEKLGEIADVVIIDGPPFVVADAAVLASKADGVVAVVRYGQTRMGAGLAMVDQLRRGNANLVGVVMNGITGQSRSYDYYSSYYHSEHRPGRWARFKARLGGGKKSRPAKPANPRGSEV